MSDLFQPSSEPIVPASSGVLPPVVLPPPPPVFPPAFPGGPPMSPQAPTPPADTGDLVWPSLLSGLLGASAGLTGSVALVLTGSVFGGELGTARTVLATLAAALGAGALLLSLVPYRAAADGRVATTVAAVLAAVGLAAAVWWIEPLPELYREYRVIAQPTPTMRTLCESAASVVAFGPGFLLLGAAWMLATRGLVKRAWAVHPQFSAVGLFVLLGALGVLAGVLLATTVGAALPLGVLGLLAVLPCLVVAGIAGLGAVEPTPTPVATEPASSAAERAGLVPTGVLYPLPPAAPAPVATGGNQGLLAWLASAAEWLAVLVTVGVLSAMFWTGALTESAPIEPVELPAADSVTGQAYRLNRLLAELPLGLAALAWVWLLARLAGQGAMLDWVPAIGWSHAVALAAAIWLPAPHGLRRISPPEPPAMTATASTATTTTERPPAEAAVWEILREWPGLSMLALTADWPSERIPALRVREDPRSGAAEWTLPRRDLVTADPPSVEAVLARPREQNFWRVRTLGTDTDDATRSLPRGYELVLLGPSPTAVATGNELPTRRSVEHFLRCRRLTLETLIQVVPAADDRVLAETVAALAAVFRDEKWDCGVLLVGSGSTRVAVLVAGSRLPTPIEPDKAVGPLPELAKLGLTKPVGRWGGVWCRPTTEPAAEPVRELGR